MSDLPKPQVIIPMTLRAQFRVSLGDDPHRPGQQRLAVEFQGRDVPDTAFRTHSTIYLPRHLAGQVADAITRLARRAAEHQLWVLPSSEARRG